ncbi:MAG: 3-deoxy-D-manno-octulosonic acid transferase [Simkaniaceae bacterium]
MHCVSIGETRACSTLASQIKEQYHDAYLIISTITETGQKEARRSIPYADCYFFLPMDFSWTMKKLVRRIKPNLFIQIETDFWYHLLLEVKRNGGQIALANGKISERSLKKYLLLKPFAKRIFQLFDLLCVQNTHYVLSFQKLGVKPNRIISTGNLKFDAKVSHLSEEHKKELKNQLGINKDDIVITIGSTHENEENILIDSFSKIWAFYPNVKIILVPRHPERFAMVRRLLKEKRISFFSYSEANNRYGMEKVILIDRMGLLNDLYQISLLAIVAGSYVPKVGGHNIFEPIEFGTPVVYGPFMQQQKSLDAMVEKGGAGKKIALEDLPDFITEFLESPALQMTMRKAALKLRGDAKGSAKRTWEHVRSLMEKTPCK